MKRENRVIHWLCVISYCQTGGVPNQSIEKIISSIEIECETLKSTLNSTLNSIDDADIDTYILK